MHSHISRLGALVCLAMTFLAACTPHKVTADRYKYLIKEKDTDGSHTAVPAKRDADLIREKAPTLNIGERLVPVLTEARDYVGTPYQHGGHSKSGIDCSGLTMVCFEKAGVALPRSAADQSAYGLQVERRDVEVGDLVFFDAKGRGKVDHVGMVTKVEGQQVIFIHSSTSKGVRYDYLNEGYWADKLVVARRVPLQ